MPSVSATAKTEKSVASFEVTDPVKFLSSMLEKRIRNLEKRKIKLDNYRSDVEKGKELNEDQKIAVSKYGEVVSCLEMSKELNKAVNGMALDYARQAKKQAKKEQIERQQHEVQRLQEAFIYSYILSCFQNEDVRSDFLNGENGAVQLTSEQLSQLDQLHKLMGSRVPTEQADIPSHFHVLAENHIFLVEGKNKEVAGTTYKVLKETLQKIRECGYFSRPSESAEESATSSDESPEEEQQQQVEESSDPVNDIQPVVSTTEEESTVDEITVEPVNNQTAPLQEVLEQQGSINFLQESQIDLDAPHMDPAVVAVHQMAPSANFSVNTYSDPEETEKESCEVVSSQQVPMLSPVTPVQHIGPPDFDPSHPIPTQTFTNQSFAVMQNMIVPQAYVPVTLHHPVIPATIAVISAPSTTIMPAPEVQKPAEPQTNGDGSHSPSDAEQNGNGIAEVKGKEGNNVHNFRGGYRGRGRGRGNFFRGRGNYQNGRGGYRDNYRERNGFNENYRERNGFNENFRRNNNRGNRGSNSNGRGRENYTHPQRNNNNYHSQKPQHHQQQHQEETQQ